MKLTSRFPVHDIRFSSSFQQQFNYGLVVPPCLHAWHAEVRGTLIQKLEYSDVIPFAYSDMQR